MTQRRMAERMDTTEATISRLLSTKRKLSEEWLHRFSIALDCTIPELYVDPNRPDPAELLRHLNDDQKRQAVDFIKFLLRTGTDG